MSEPPHADTGAGAAEPGMPTEARLVLTVRELSAPIDALCRRVSRLAAAAPENAPVAFRTAVEGLTLRSGQMQELVRQGLDPGGAAGVAILDRTFHHDLRGHLAYVLGSCELWQRKAPTLMLESHLPELGRIHDAAEQARTLLDRLTALAAGETPPEPLPVIPYASPPALHVGESGRLLIVDDSDLNRELLRDTLAHLGHQVIEAPGGFEALEMLDQLPAGTVELILLDVMMPGLDGPATLQRLKGDPKTRNVPVIMISALDRLESVVACIAAGAEDYLVRPCNELLLQARVGACLERKRLHDRETQYLAQIDELLHAIFPHEIVVELKESNTIRPRRYERVGVLFLDVVGFTAFSDAHRDQPEFVVEALQQQVALYEQAALRHGVQKIKTIGDAFMAVAGLPTPCDDPVSRLLRCGVDLVEAARSSPAGWQVRVGIHVGPVVAGKLGQFQYTYDLWGATVNLASRMESTSRTGAITLSPDAWAEVEAFCEGQPRDAAVRGIGPMTVWEFERFRTPPPRGGGPFQAEARYP